MGRSGREWTGSTPRARSGANSFQRNTRLGGGGLLEGDKRGQHIAILWPCSPPSATAPSSNKSQSTHPRFRAAVTSRAHPTPTSTSPSSLSHSRPRARIPQPYDAFLPDARLSMPISARLDAATTDEEEMPLDGEEAEEAM